MTCSFCAFDFDPEVARRSCAGCAFAGAGCRSLCCPRCGYDTPEEPALFARLRAWLGGRPASPPRPSGEVTTLLGMGAGQRGTVVKLEVSDLGQARKLMALGVIPGAPIELERVSPAVVFRTGYTQLAVDEALARSVLVRLGACGENERGAPARRREEGEYSGI